MGATSGIVGISADVICAVLETPSGRQSTGGVGGYEIQITESELKTGFSLAVLGTSYRCSTHLTPTKCGGALTNGGIDGFRAGPHG